MTTDNVEIPMPGDGKSEDVKYDQLFEEPVQYMLSHNGHRLNIQATCPVSQRLFGAYMESSVPYQTVKAWRRDYMQQTHDFLVSLAADVRAWTDECRRRAGVTPANESNIILLRP
jgi:hypothetical protein